MKIEIDQHLTNLKKIQDKFNESTTNLTERCALIKVFNHICEKELPIHDQIVYEDVLEDKDIKTHKHTSQSNILNEVLPMCNWIEILYEDMIEDKDIKTSLPEDDSIYPNIKNNPCTNCTTFAICKLYIYKSLHTDDLFLNYCIYVDARCSKLTEYMQMHEHLPKSDILRKIFS